MFSNFFVKVVTTHSSIIQWHFVITVKFTIKVVAKRQCSLRETLVFFFNMITAVARRIQLVFSVHIFYFFSFLIRLLLPFSSDIVLLQGKDLLFSCAYNAFYSLHFNIFFVINLFYLWERKCSTSFSIVQMESYLFESVVYYFIYVFLICCNFSRICYRYSGCVQSPKYF